MICTRVQIVLCRVVGPYGVITYDVGLHHKGHHGFAFTPFVIHSEIIAIDLVQLPRR